MTADVANQRTLYVTTDLGIYRDIEQAMYMTWSVPWHYPSNNHKLARSFDDHGLQTHGIMSRWSLDAFLKVPGSTNATRADCLLRQIGFSVLP